MKNTTFQYCIKGTSLEACLLARNYKNDSIIVFDDKTTYGSSINYKECIIETKPQLIRTYDKIVKVLQDMNIQSMIDFVVINNHLYIKDKKLTKIPVNKNEIADSCFLTKKDKYFLYKAIKNHDITQFNNLSENSLNILNKSICGGSFCLQKMLRFARSFDSDYYLLYPLYGFVDICEKMSRCNAINGVSYVLNENLTYKNEHSKVRIDTKFGTIVCDKLLYAPNTDNKKKKVVVINYKDAFYMNSFYGIFDLDELVYCITLDTNACVCPKNTFLIYLWKENSNITDKDLLDIGIEDEKVIFKESFDMCDKFEYDLIIN